MDERVRPGVDAGFGRHLDPARGLLPARFLEQVDDGRHAGSHLLDVCA
jgi:hypothetical protein